MDLSRRAVLSGFVGGVTALGVGTVVETGATEDAHARSRVPSRVREYWLQVENQHVDLSPRKFDPMMGLSINQRTEIDALVYRAYTPHWGTVLPSSREIGPNTGFPGPVIRGEVGDRIVVHLRNMDTVYGQPHSLHPHGLRYAPSSCGSWTSEYTQPGSAVDVGKTYTYEWDAVASSVGTWPYHDHSKPFRVPGTGGGGEGGGSSHMHQGLLAMPVMEMGAQLGLMGHIVITRPRDPLPDREFFLVFHDLYASDVANIDGDIDCFNGRAFLGNTPTFQAKVGERVRWHVIALGTELHVFHVHGHRWRGPGGRFIDSEMLGPSTSLVADYVEDNPGRFLYHCHLIDHMTGGMVGYYLVDDA